jgi:hypothetical protein
VAVVGVTVADVTVPVSTVRVAVAEEPEKPELPE